MKIKCKDNLQTALDGYTRFKLALTIDKEYDVVREKKSYYLIINDKNKLINYSKERFEIMEG